MSNLVETNFSSPEYVLARDCTFATVERFSIMVAKHQQTTSAQLRLWVSPHLDPASPEARDVCGQALDNGLFMVAHKLCEARVGKNGMAVAEAFNSLQSVLRNAFPTLKGNGGNVSVRYAEVKPDASGDYGKTTIASTKAFADSPFAEWSRVGEDGILRIAKIAWKQALRVDILDPITAVHAAPGGENIHPAGQAGDNDSILPFLPDTTGHRETGYTQHYVEDAIEKAIKKDRKGRRVRLEERDVLAVVRNCHGEIALAVRAAAMTRFGLIEPVCVAMPTVGMGKRMKIRPEDVLS